MNFKVTVEAKYRIIYADAKKDDERDADDDKTGFSKALDDGTDDCADNGFPTKCKKT